jgi:hypothetical protein
VRAGILTVVAGLALLVASACGGEGDKDKAAKAPPTAAVFTATSTATPPTTATPAPVSTPSRTPSPTPSPTLAPAGGAPVQATRLACTTELESLTPLRTRLRAVLTTTDGRPVGGQELRWSLPAPLYPQGIRSPQFPSAEPSRTDPSGSATVIIAWPPGMPVSVSGTATVSYEGDDRFGPSRCTVQLQIQSTG